MAASGSIGQAASSGAQVKRGPRLTDSHPGSVGFGSEGVPCWLALRRGEERRGGWPARSTRRRGLDIAAYGQ